FTLNVSTLLEFPSRVIYRVRGVGLGWSGVGQQSPSHLQLQQPYFLRHAEGQQATIGTACRHFA
ncbi:MAG TPA: hypothetical protein VN207_04945, partial [Ktedonobacteraceae bacterium]|nr:hypothetical protein [Ktedonobacteraceae bacterium]